MNKDVIYIDVEDDITAVIGKIKASSEKIVALVPPKHVGLLQSAVNLRLLDRMAGNSHKRLVIITNNQALIALSAVAGIPVAKNLQSKPEIAPIAALEIDDGEDVIDGSSLPIGDLQKTADLPVKGLNSTKKGSLNSDIDTLDIDNAAVATGVARVGGAKLAGRDSKVKIPNFGSFRKRLFIGIAAFVLLVGFIVWANVFAPAAKVIITARTTAASVNSVVTLGDVVATDVPKASIQSLSKQIKKDATIQFDATGTSTVGDKATGQIVFKNCEVPTPQTIAAGTIITAGGLNYATQSAVTVPAGVGGFTGCTSAGVSDPVSIAASDIGTNYNVASNTTFSVAGHSNSSAAYLRAVASTNIAGGTSRQITIVSADDVTKATASLAQQSSDDIKNQLKAQFTGGEVIIDDSFVITPATPVSVPAVGAEATAKATLTSSTTYTITAVTKPNIELFLKDSIAKQLSSTKNQRMYDDGISTVRLTAFTKSGTTNTITIVGTGQIGPDINQDALKQQVKGKIVGDVQAIVQATDGVSNVDVRFSYPWVTKVPNDVNKITIEFKIQNG